MLTENRLPLPFKLAYTAFMAVLIPVYWHYYGPSNFLYFCDVALIITLIAVWIESPLLVSMCAVGILLPQIYWCIDFMLLVCFLFMPPPRPDPGLTPVNINYVWGMNDAAAQTWVHPYVWLAGLMIGLPLIVFVPTHFMLVRYVPKTP